MPTDAPSGVNADAVSGNHTQRAVVGKLPRQRCGRGSQVFHERVVKVKEERAPGRGEVAGGCRAAAGAQEVAVVRGEGAAVEVADDERLRLGGDARGGVVQVGDARSGKGAADGRRAGRGRGGRHQAMGGAAATSASRDSRPPLVGRGALPPVAALARPLRCSRSSRMMAG